MSVPRPTLTLAYNSLNNSEPDLALLLYDSFGQLLQVCFDGKSCKAISHSGDSKTSSGGESATIDFHEMPAAVAYIVVAVALNSTNPLCSFSLLRLYSAELQYQVDLLALASTSPTPVHNFAPLLLKRVPGTVGFVGMPMNAMDNLQGGEAGLANIWRVSEFLLQTQIAPAMWNQVKHSHVELYALKSKQSVAIQPQVVNFFGLGWSPSAKDEIDLDTHAYLIDFETKSVEHIYFNNKHSKDGAVNLDQDDRNGDGEEGADDERMFISLDRVNSKIDVIFIVIRIYDKPGVLHTFDQVKGEFCRAADAKGNTIVRFALDGEKKYASRRNVVMCALRRDSKQSNNWNMQAIGESLQESDFNSNLYTNLLKLI